MRNKFQIILSSLGQRLRSYFVFRFVLLGFQMLNNSFPYFLCPPGPGLAMAKHPLRNMAWGSLVGQSLWSTRWWRQGHPLMFLTLRVAGREGRQTCIDCCDEVWLELRRRSSWEKKGGWDKGSLHRENSGLVPRSKWTRREKVWVRQDLFYITFPVSFSWSWDKGSWQHMWQSPILNHQERFLG